MRTRKRVVRYARPAAADANTIQPMTAVQAVVVGSGSLLLLTAMIAGMIRANESERRYMERRREEWIARGRIPEEEPNFYTGSSGDTGS